MQSGNTLKNNEHPFAFFDFCETLVNFQTADAFVDFVRIRRGNLYTKAINLFLITIVKFKFHLLLNKFFPNAGVIKKIKLLQLRGRNSKVLNQLAEEYYRELIKPNLITPVMMELKKLQEKNYNIVIVSAGYSIYLKYFTKEHNIQYLISTEIAFDKSGETCLGTISGKDCIYTEKVDRINKVFDIKKLNLKRSVSFSDSISDLPMMQMTNKAVVVSKDKSQDWAKEYDFSEIIWSNN